MVVAIQQVHRRMHLIRRRTCLELAHLRAPAHANNIISHASCVHFQKVTTHSLTKTSDLLPVAVQSLYNS